MNNHIINFHLPDERGVMASLDVADVIDDGEERVPILPHWHGLIWNVQEMKLKSTNSKLDELDCTNDLERKDNKISKEWRH